MTDAAPAEPSPMMRPAEVALAFNVDPKTVARWADSGVLPVVRTPGGHRRFLRTDVAQLLQVGARHTGDQA